MTVPQGDDSWFREPNARERRLATGLFLGFGVFFALLFVLAHGWWFRWVLLALAVYSILTGLRHARAARRPEP